jgi:uncharacterized lipoprotein YajG
VISATAILVFAGCGNSTTITSVSAPEESQSLIRGEVIEVTGVEAQTGREGDLGTVLVEGARSSPVDEALLTVTKYSKIIDRRSGTDKTTNLDAVNERQTVEADFKVVSSSPQPWRAEVEELVICP